MKNKEYYLFNNNFSSSSLLSSYKFGYPYYFLGKNPVNDEIKLCHSLIGSTRLSPYRISGDYFHENEKLITSILSSTPVDYNTLHMRSHTNGVFQLSVHPRTTISEFQKASNSSAIKPITGEDPISILSEFFQLNEIFKVNST